MAILSQLAGPPVEWAGLPVSPTMPYLRVSKVCSMLPRHKQQGARVPVVCQVLTTALPGHKQEDAGVPVVCQVRMEEGRQGGVGDVTLTRRLGHNRL